MIIGIIGHGAFGQLIETLVHRFLPSVEVRIVSSRHAPDGKRFYTLSETCASNVLFLAVPISHIEETLGSIIPHLGKSTVVVDVATVKTHSHTLFSQMLASHPYVLTHPMFGPESYRKKEEDITGFRIVISGHTLAKEQYEMSVAFLRNLGAIVIEMSPDEHDTRLAETLFLTHFVGQTISRAGFVRTDIDTVSFGYLMEAVESVKNDTRLFTDVYQYNPYCKHTLDRFEGAEREVRNILEQES